VIFVIKVMEESKGSVIGFRAIGDITREDYDKLTPICEELIEQQGNIRVLIDMKDFKLEEPSAWKADFHFGHEFHNKIEKMAIVGNKRWEAWMTDFCNHFYAKEAKYFKSENIEDAWNWLRVGLEEAA
jgi:hypothetical protein